jgi:hypothetical protein
VVNPSRPPCGARKQERTHLAHITPQTLPPPRARPAPSAIHSWKRVRAGRADPWNINAPLKPAPPPQNAIRKKHEQLNYLKLASRLDAVVSRLDTQAKMQMVTKNMAAITKNLEKALASNNLEKIAATMQQFEKQFENLDLQVLGERGGRRLVTCCGVR